MPTTTLEVTARIMRNEQATRYSVAVDGIEEWQRSIPSSASPLTQFEARTEMFDYFRHAVMREEPSR